MSKRAAPVTAVMPATEICAATSPRYVMIVLHQPVLPGILTLVALS